MKWSMYRIMNLMAEFGSIHNRMHSIRMIRELLKRNTVRDNKLVLGFISKTLIKYFCIWCLKQADSSFNQYKTFVKIFYDSFSKSPFQESTISLLDCINRRFWIPIGLYAPGTNKICSRTENLGSRQLELGQ